MNESIDLKTFTTNNSTENDIQEYHEIKQDTTLDDVDTSFSSKQSPKLIDDYDFFTQYDVNAKSKKKKKAKKKEKSNLMDIIKSQIAAVSVLIAENVITNIDNSKDHQNRYLRTSFRRNYKKSRHFFDAEYGLYRSFPVELSPIFPTVLENAITNNSCFPVEYVYPTSFDEIAAANCAIDEDMPAKFLDVSIQNITFKHHHSYSLEKLLCFKVVEKYKQYEHVQKSLKDLSRDIKICRQTKYNLKNDLLKVVSSKKENVRFDETLRKYAANLIQFKEKQTELFKIKKELTHKIVTLWSDIEMVRERSEHKETPYKLELTKRFLDHNQYEKEWKETFDFEFMDKLDEIEYHYVSEYLEYKKAKNEQKENINTKLNKPQLQIDEDAIKERAEELANTIVSKDQIELDLKRDVSSVNNFVASVTKHSYHFEIYIDDIFVCESEHYFSNDANNIEFTENFSVQILAKNAYIKIVLLENGNIVSRIKINLADVKKAISTAEFKVETFCYDNDVSPNAEQVGSGHSIKEIALANKVRLRSSNLFKGNLYSNCEINVKVGWNDKIEQNRTEAIKCSMNTGRQIKRLLNDTDKPTLNALMTVISEIYEKDIDDENMIETLEKLSKLEVTLDDSFPIDDNSDLTRLKLLHLRNIGGFSTIEKKLVPLHASQISTEQLNCLQKKNEKELDMDYLNDREMEMDPIELQRFIGLKYIQKLNKNMLKNVNEYLLQKTHKDVVTEFNFSLRSLFTKQANDTNLGTLSNSTKQQILSESLSKEQEIQVIVLRAFNLLDRSSNSLEEADDEADKIAGFKTRSLRPFVCVNYKGVAAQTVIAMGSNPTWNHTLKIKSKLEPLSCLQINVFDEYKVQILDGFSEDEQSNRTVHYRFYNKWLGTLLIPIYTVLSMGSIRGTYKVTTPPVLFGYETLHNKDCTSLKPEISQLIKKDTSFITLEVTTSLSHLGGLQAYSQPLPCTIEDDYLIKHLNNFVTDYVNHFPTRNISLTFIDSAGRNKCVTQFLQPINLPEKDLFPKTPRSESAISKSSGLSKSSSSSGRQKDMNERVIQEDRESLYSGTIAEADNLTKMINACMRYVSLIPNYEVIESHVVTLFGTELLKILHGSPLDHTLLLASYFICLGIKCWVAIGLGLPRGPSSYVLIKYDLISRKIVLENEPLRSKGFLNRGDGYSWIVCDASSGQRYELRDVGCPLQTVDYVFDNENIWVNMQVSQDCESMSFDFSRSSEWQPVFDKTIYVMKQQLVMDPSLYSPPPNVEGLRVTLEAKIKAKIQKWRPHMKTIWNRYCSTLLREMLPQWEYWAFNPTGTKPGFSQRMKQLMVTYKIFGFPLNVSYINTKSVISAVKSTGLHITDDPIVEFALAVELYAYPNNVISVWMFLATITRI